MKDILPVFASLMGVGSIAGIVFLLILAIGNPAPVEALKGQSEDCEPAHDLSIKAGDGSWHRVVLYPAPGLHRMPYTKEKCRILWAHVLIERPKQICVEGLSPLAGRATRLDGGGMNTTGILVDFCQSPREPSRRPLNKAVFVISIAAPKNLSSDAIIIRNQ